MRDAFTVDIGSSQGAILARFHGDLTFESEEAMVAAFGRVAFDDAPRLTIDFTDVPHVNSSGIAALLGVLHVARERCSGITFTGLNPHLEKIFRMTGFQVLVEL